MSALLRQFNELASQWQQDHQQTTFEQLMGTFSRMKETALSDPSCTTELLTLLREFNPRGFHNFGDDLPQEVLITSFTLREQHLMNYHPHDVTLCLSTQQAATHFL